jgi:heat shock protein HtpX
MAGTLLLIGLLYVGVGAALAAYAGHAAGIAVAIGLVALTQYRYGHTLALKTVGGQVVSRTEYPALHARVDRLAQSAGVPAPDVAVADTDVPNALAAGRGPDHAVVCVTTGLVETLDEAELDAVLAHELAHVKHRDVLVMTVAGALSAVTGWVVRWGFLFDGGDGGGGDTPQFWVAYLAALVVWVGSFFAIRLLSRYREFAADRGAVSITGDPSALASALVSIDDRLADVPAEDLRSVEGANALLFAEATESRLARWFRTHPDVERRVERLRALERELHG